MGTDRMTTALPPHDEQAEEAVLGSLLLDGGGIEAIDLLASDFYSTKHRQVYEAMLALADRGEPLNHITVAHEMALQDTLEAAGGQGLLSNLTLATPVSVHLEHYAHIVQQCSARRRLIEAAGTIAGLGYDGMDPLAAVEQAHRLLETVSTSRPDTERDMPAVVAEFEAELASPQPTALSTGFRDLERYRLLAPATLAVLAARPGAGKTALALGIAVHAASKGHSVRLYSLEMGGTTLLQRMASGLSGVPLTAIINRSMSPDERERLTDTLRRIERLPMVIDDSPTVTARGVISRVQRAEARGHVDLVIVDYLQLLQATDTRKPRAEQVADMTRELREMARSVGCSLLVLAQLNREVEKRMGGEPLLSDLRESGAIEQDADTVTFAVDATGGLSEEQWEQRHPTKRYPESLVRLLVRKNRNGPPGEATLFFRRPHTWFYSIGDE